MSKANRGHRYTDPMYDEIEASLEQELGLPAGGMRAIRTKGERSNADQVSPVGARTVYQIMPQTRRLFQKKYGVDAYQGPEAAARVAALHLKESMARNGGSWEAAVGEYHGGPNRRNWGRVNQAYRQRVLGGGGGGEVPDVPATPVPEVPKPSIEDMLGATPGELFGEADTQLRAAKRQVTDNGPSVSDMVKQGLIGDEPLQTEAPDLTPVDREVEIGKAQAAEQAQMDSYGHWDHFKAGMSKTLLGELIDAFGEQSQEFDPEFMQFYKDNWQDIESFAQSDHEVSMLREATSADHLNVIRAQIEEDRETDKIIQSSASPTALMIGTGVLDPVGWAAGFGVGKTFQLLGAGSRTLFASGRPIAGLASASAEGAIGNLAFTAGFDALGEETTAADYVLSATTGLIIGATLGKIEGSLSVDKLARDRADAAYKAAEQVRKQVENDVLAEMPTVSAEELAQEVNKRVTQDYLDTVEYALADIPAEQRIMVAEEILTDDPQLRSQVDAANDLAQVSDDSERAITAEIIARSERIAAANPVDKKALQTILAKAGQEANSTRLLLSESPVARAIGTVLLENPQGAAGRTRTAALVMAQRERVYNETFAAFDGFARTFRQREGITALRDFWDGKARNQFNRRVMLEVERRQGTPAGKTFDSNPAVIQAANLFETGMDMMRIEQQKVGTVGAARLGDNSRGYVPHRLDSSKLMALTASERSRVRDILASQFEAIEGFDTAFSEKLAAKYLERGIDAAAGRYQVPFNLHSPEAGQIVRDALEAMRLDPAEIDKLMGKYSRGGASHTKRRLRLDLDADLGNGKKLIDIFNTDVPALYRAYARRVSGEVALAQYGVMGKKGLNTISKAMTATGATPDEIKAFDQIAAEFLNTPFGEANHVWFDNVRLATSASRLGGMAFTQLAEFGNAIPSLGVQASFKGVAAVPRLAKEVREIANGSNVANPILKDLDTLGGHVGLEDYHMTRMFDVRDNDIELYNGNSLGVFSRAMRAGAHGNMILSGHRMILGVQTRSMAEQIVRKAVKYAKTGEADKALDDMGIHAGLREAIRKDLNEIATFDDAGELLTLDLFKGKALDHQKVAELSQAIERGASQIIQRTYTGETGAWAHNGFLKLLFQFRTFSLTSVEKQWGRNMKNYGALKSFMYLMGAASFAVPIHLARVQAKMLGMKESERGAYWEQNANPMALSRAVMNYTSSAGLTGDVMDVGASLFSNYGGDFGDRFAETYSPRGKRSDQFIGGVVAPSAGLVQDAYQGIIEGQPRKIIKSLPGSNLPYTSPLIEAALRDD